MSAQGFQNPKSGYPMILWHDDKKGSSVEIDWDYALEYGKPTLDDLVEAKRLSALVQGEDFEGALSILKGQGVNDLS